MNKKAILLVSFGTTYHNIREKTIDKIEEKVKAAFPDYEVRRAFTSPRIINKLKNKYNISELLPYEALNFLKQQGFSEVIVQSLHIIPGEEYNNIKNEVQRFKSEFYSIELGRPMLYYKGGNGQVPDDYSILLDALKPQIDGKETTLLIGHGSSHPADAAYSCLQLSLEDNGINNVYVTTLQGYPKVTTTIEKIKLQGIKKVRIIPLLLAAGHHLTKDIFGENESSVENILKKDGFQVEVYEKSLGENPLIQDIYLEHINDIIRGNYK